MKLVSWMWKKSPPPKEEEEVDEDELRKKGFNPQGLPIEQLQAEDFQNLDRDYEGFISPSPHQALELINNYKYFPTDDQPRHPLAYSKGGKICGQKSQVNKIRSIGKEMIKQIGRKIISGEFNLTHVSFPIKVMVPKTALQNSTISCSLLPYFMKRATESKDPLQRMKYVVTNTIAAFYYMNLFLKPVPLSLRQLNPVLGQTLQASYPDGTQIYCEQITHHPPVSYFLAVGPHSSYRYYGYYAFEALAGLNSMTLHNKGTRKYEFMDGTHITATFCKEIYSGVFIGTLRSEAIESMIIEDKTNALRSEVKFGKMKKKPSDYFESTITHKGKIVSNYYGTYCGFIDFDGVRYWDGRYMQAFKLNFQPKPLQSDFKNRDDLKILKTKNIESAQRAKEIIEESQRRDARLRQKKK